MTKIEVVKKLTVLVLIAVVIVFPWNESQAQSTKKSYEILLAGFQIGKMDVEELKKGSLIEYNLKSLVSFWFFGKINVDLSIKSIYKDGMMLSSESKSVSNRGSFYSKILWNGKSYDVDSHTYEFDNNRAITKPIPFSTVKFYFQEPMNGLTMVSETYGLTSLISELESKTYRIEIDGNKNKFFYENGEMEKALMESPIKNYVIKRIK